MVEKSTELTQLLAILDDSQAIDIEVIDVKDQTSVTDYMIICTGRSSRHVKAIGETVVELMKSHGLRSLSDVGLEAGDWALIDFGDYVVHVMQPDSRAFYNLEGLWKENPNES